MAMAALALTACQQEQDDLSPEAIELTTPVIRLDGVAASTRAALDANVANYAGINLFLHDSDARECNDNRIGYYDGTFYDGINWSANPSVTVTGGEGHYRAGIFATIHLKATADMLAIENATYAYRGSVNVKADGSFTPDGTLKPYSAAVFLNLKDADGNIIDPFMYDTSDGMEADGAKPNGKVYLIKPVGIARMAGFAPDSDDQVFPNGIADPVPYAITHSAYELTSSARGDFTPGTYPATWRDRLLVTSAIPSTAWPLFEVTYCKDGFIYDEEGELVPNGATTTTWTVSYPAQQLTLDAGKLYTFTATLGADAHITLDAASAVSISDWATGEQINIGR